MSIVAEPSLSAYVNQMQSVPSQMRKREKKSNEIVEDERRKEQKRKFHRKRKRSNEITHSECSKMSKYFISFYFILFVKDICICNKGSTLNKDESL